MSSVVRANGRIELIIGCMNSGKTTELRRRVNRFKIAGHKCLVIKYIKDNRYGDDCISTHDKLTMQVDVAVANLSELKEETFKDVDVIGVDEGQFIIGLSQFCEHHANHGRIVLVSALDGTFERKPFPSVMELIPLAERVDKLSAICMLCHKEAAFSSRISNERQVEVIGGADKYNSTCRECFFTSKVDLSSPLSSPSSTSLLSSSPSSDSSSSHSPSSSPSLSTSSVTLSSSSDASSMMTSSLAAITSPVSWSLL